MESHDLKKRGKMKWRLETGPEKFIPSVDPFTVYWSLIRNGLTGRLTVTLKDGKLVQNDTITGLKLVAAGLIERSINVQYVQRRYNSKFLQPSAKQWRLCHDLGIWASDVGDLKDFAKGFIFQSGNDPKHTCNTVNEYLPSETLSVIDWPPQSWISTLLKQCEIILTVNGATGR